MMGSERVGPMSLGELCNLPLMPTTPVWHPGMTNWADAVTLPELADRFGMMPPQPQAPAYGCAPAQQPYGAPVQQPYGGGYMPPMPNNYLAWSIIVTLLCCLPFGIVAIVYSSKVSSAYNQGDYDGALKASNTAKNWCIGSAVAGLVWGLIYGGLVLVGALAELG